jgi:DNA-binding winged helix-turn-helix (wHTH) protein
MPDAIEIPLCPGPVDGSIRPPGSKSITNRAVICAALARGTSQLSGVLDSQDTRVMAAGLAALGIDIATDWGAGTMQVVGCGGRIPAAEATIDCAASGTTMRFLSAVSSLGTGTYRLDGTPRMRQRPIDDLLEPLRSLGIDLEDLAIGEQTLDLAARTLELSDQITVLTSGEYALLSAFVQHPHRPLSRERLVELARGPESATDSRSMDVQVSRLRKLVEPDPGRPRYLQTVWGYGYVFVPDGQPRSR